MHFIFQGDHPTRGLWELFKGCADITCKYLVVSFIYISYIVSTIAEWILEYIFGTLACDTI